MGCVRATHGMEFEADQSPRTFSPRETPPRLGIRVFNLNRGACDDIPEADIDLQRNTGAGQTGFEQYSDAFVCLFIANLFDTDGVHQEDHAIVFRVLPTPPRTPCGSPSPVRSRFPASPNPASGDKPRESAVAEEAPLQHKTIAVPRDAQAMQETFQGKLGQKHSKVLPVFIGQVQQSLAHRCRQVRGCLHAIDSRYGCITRATRHTFAAS
jgi:hypothetical protein